MNERAQGNALKRLGQLGQSVWLDYIQRALLTDGGLARLIAEDGVSGVTSNPAIFERAISAHDEYDEVIADLARAGEDAHEICESLTIEDVGRAADLLRPVYEGTAARDGYVSIEVSPHLAADTEATVSEALRIRERLDRPNVMIKVPATPAGIPAIRRLVGQGVNVNATLLFSVARYLEVAQAYLQGLKERAKAGRPIANVSSVASFFVSRIDTLVDRLLDETGKPGAGTLRGQAATACARLAYREFQRQQADTVWQQLTALGARPQRLLWASTSTKNPDYSDIRYVDPLIAPQTINTMTQETMTAYRHHGEPKVRIEESLAEAEVLVARLATFGIDLDQVAAELEDAGIRRFAEAAHAARERMRDLVPQES